MSQSVIRLRCPNLLCGRVLAIPGHARGKRVKCRACSTIMSVPRKSASPGATEQGGKTDEGEGAAAA